MKYLSLSIMLTLSMFKFYNNTILGIVVDRLSRNKFLMLDEIDVLNSADLLKLSHESYFL